MLSYQEFVTNCQNHDQAYLDYPSETADNIQDRIRDDSCQICFPKTNDYRDQFHYFWNWYYITYPAIDFTRRTYIYFETCIVYDTYQAEFVKRLVYSIRYSEPVHFRRVIKEVIEAFQIYLNFIVDPADVDIIEPSPSLDHSTIPESTYLFEESSSNASTQTPTNTSRSPSQQSNRPYTPLSDLESLDLEQLFQEHTMANAQAVLEYLKSNLNQPFMRVESFFGDGTQDPLTWYDAFTKARKSNGWDHVKSVNMFGAHLQEAADDWWNTYINTNGNDFTQNPYRWGDLETAFTEQFCTQRWLNKWIKDLEGRRQGPNESVDSYFTDFKKLIKRVDMEGQMTDAQKLQHFLRGLRPEIAPIVAMTAPANILAALATAQHYKAGQDLINYKQSVTRPERNSGHQTKEANTGPIKDLILKFEKMHLKLAEQIDGLATQVEQRKQYSRTYTD